MTDHTQTPAPVPSRPVSERSEDWWETTIAGLEAMINQLDKTQETRP